MIFFFFTTLLHSVSLKIIRYSVYIPKTFRHNSIIILSYDSMKEHFLQQWQSVISPSVLVYTNLLLLIWIHARFRSCNQPVLSNECIVVCSTKEREPLIGSNSRLTSTHQLRVRLIIHCDMPTLVIIILVACGNMNTIRQFRRIWGSNAYIYKHIF